MPPKKIQSKKRKASAASSSGAQGSNLLIHKDYAKERKKRFQKMKFINHQYLDWEVMFPYGMMEVLHQVIKDPIWLKVFDIQEPTFMEITMEFLSTMYIETENEVTVMKFQAYGEIQQIELKRIGYILGLYEAEEATAHLSNSWPDNMSPSTFWLELIKPKTDPFIPSKSLSTTFTATEHKLLHHILSHTISCKKTSHSKVTSFDVFYLYCMITGYQIDLGVELANFIDRQISDTRTKVISCGGYITALLKGMGIFQQPEEDDGIECKKISSAPFRLWGLHKTSETTARDDEEAEESAQFEITPYMGPSSSSAPPPPPPTTSRYDQLSQKIDKMQKDNEKERKKNKKFRKSLIDMLKGAFSCINQAAADHIQYQTSDEEESTEEEGS